MGSPDGRVETPNMSNSQKSENRVELASQPHAAFLQAHQASPHALASAAAGQRTDRLARRLCPRPSGAWCGPRRLGLVPARIASEARREPRQPQQGGGSLSDAQSGKSLGAVDAAIQIPADLVGVCHRAVDMDFAVARDAVLAVAELVDEGVADGADVAHRRGLSAIFGVPDRPNNDLNIGHQTTNVKDFSTQR